MHRLGDREQALQRVYGERLVRVPANRAWASMFDSPHHYYVVAGSAGLDFGIDDGRVPQFAAASADSIDGVMREAGTAIP